MPVLLLQKKNTDKEIEAVKKIITDVTDAYRARDYNKIATAYVQDKSLVKIGVTKSGFGVNHGWQKVSENYKNNFKNNPDPSIGKYEKINFRVKVYKESAWAIHDEIITSEDGNKYKNIITHFLEKSDGKWKVVYMSNIRASSWDVAE